MARVAVFHLEVVTDPLPRLRIRPMEVDLTITGIRVPAVGRLPVAASAQVATMVLRRVLIQIWVHQLSLYRFLIRPPVSRKFL